MTCMLSKNPQQSTDSTDSTSALHVPVKAAYLGGNDHTIRDTFSANARGGGGGIVRDEGREDHQAWSFIP